MTKISDENVCRDHMEQMRWGCNPQCPSVNPSNLMAERWEKI